MYPASGNSNSRVASGSEGKVFQRGSKTLPSLLLLTALFCGHSRAQFLPISAATPSAEASVAQLIAQARASMNRGDLERERTALEQALALAPTNRDARLALADVFMRLARWKEAQSQAQILLTQFPADTEPVFLLAMIAM